MLGFYNLVVDELIMNDGNDIKYTVSERYRSDTVNTFIVFNVVSEEEDR